MFEEKDHLIIFAASAVIVLSALVLLLFPGLVSFNSGPKRLSNEKEILDLINNVHIEGQQGYERFFKTDSKENLEKGNYEAFLLNLMNVCRFASGSADYLVRAHALTLKSLKEQGITYPIIIATPSAEIWDCR